MREQVARDIRVICNALDRAEADRLLGQTVSRYRESAPKFAEWLEADLPEGLAV